MFFSSDSFVDDCNKLLSAYEETHAEENLFKIRIIITDISTNSKELNKIAISDENAKREFISKILPKVGNSFISLPENFGIFKISILNTLAIIYSLCARDGNFEWVDSFSKACSQFSTQIFIKEAISICPPMERNADSDKEKPHYINEIKWKTNSHTIAFILAANSMFSIAFDFLKNEQNPENFHIFTDFLACYAPFLSRIYLISMGEFFARETPDLLSIPVDVYKFVLIFTEFLPDLQDINSIYSAEAFNALIESNNMEAVYKEIENLAATGDAFEYQKIAPHIYAIAVNKPKEEKCINLLLNLIVKLNSFGILNKEELCRAVVDQPKLFSCVFKFLDERSFIKVIEQIRFNPIITNVFLAFLREKPTMKIKDLPSILLKALYNMDEKSYMLFTWLRELRIPIITNSLKEAYEKLIDTYDPDVLTPKILVLVCEFIAFSFNEVKFDTEKLEELIYQVASSEIIVALFNSLRHFTFYHPDEFVEVASPSDRMLIHLRDHVRDYTVIEDYLLELNESTSIFIEILIKAFKETGNYKFLWKAFFSVDSNTDCLVDFITDLQETIDNNCEFFFSLFDDSENALKIAKGFDLFDVSSLSPELVFEAAKKHKNMSFISYRMETKIDCSYEKYMNEKNEERKIIILDALNNSTIEDFWEQFGGETKEIECLIHKNTENDLITVTKITILFSSIVNITRRNVPEELGTSMLSYALENKNNDLCIKSIPFAKFGEELITKIFNMESRNVISKFMQLNKIEAAALEALFANASIAGATEILKNYKGMIHADKIIEKLNIVATNDCSMYIVFLKACLEELPQEDEETSKKLMSHLCSLKSQELIKKAQNLIISHVSNSLGFLEFCQNHCFRKFTHGRSAFEHTGMSSAGIALLNTFSSMPFVVSAFLNSKEERNVELGKILNQLNKSSSQKIKVPSSIISMFPYLIENDFKEVFRTAVSQLPNHLAYKFGTEYTQKIFSKNDESTSYHNDLSISVNYKIGSLANSFTASISGSNEFEYIYDNEIEEYIAARRIRLELGNEVVLLSIEFDGKGMKVTQDEVDKMHVSTYICIDTKTKKYVTYIYDGKDSWIRCSTDETKKVSGTLPDDSLRYAFLIRIRGENVEKHETDTDAVLSMILQSEDVDFSVFLGTDYCNEIAITLFRTYNSYALIDILIEVDDAFTNENMLELLISFNDSLPNEEQLLRIERMASLLEETESILFILQDWILDSNRFSVVIRIINSMKLTSEQLKDFIICIPNNYQIKAAQGFNSFIETCIKTLSEEDAKEAITNTIFCESVLQLSDEKTLNYFIPLTKETVQIASKYASSSFLIKLLGNEPDTEFIILSLQKLLLNPNFDELFMNTKLSKALRDVQWIEKALTVNEQDGRSKASLVIKKVFPIDGEKEVKLASALASSFRFSSQAENIPNLFNLVKHFKQWFTGEESSCIELSQKICSFIFTARGKNVSLVPEAIEISGFLPLPNQDWFIASLDTFNNNDDLKECPRDFIRVTAFVISCMARNVELFNMVPEDVLGEILKFCCDHKAGRLLEVFCDAYRKLFDAFTLENLHYDSTKIVVLSTVVEPFFEGKKVLATKEWIINTDFENYLALGGFILSDYRTAGFIPNKEEMLFSIEWMKKMVTRRKQEKIKVVSNFNSYMKKVIEITAAVFGSLENVLSKGFDFIFVYFRYLMMIFPYLIPIFINNVNYVSILRTKKQKIYFNEMYCSMAQYAIEDNIYNYRSEILRLPFSIFFYEISNDINSFDVMKPFIDYFTILLSDELNSAYLSENMRNGFDVLSLLVSLVHYCKQLGPDDSTFEEYTENILSILEFAYNNASKRCFSGQSLECLIKEMRPENLGLTNIIERIIDDYSDKIKENAELYFNLISQIIEQYGDDEDESISKLIDKLLILMS